MFDKTLQNLRLARAKSRFKAGDDFLMSAASAECIERLSLVSREFDNAIALYGRSPMLWQAMSETPQIKNVMRVETEHSLGNTDHIGPPENIDLPPDSTDLVIAPLTLHWSNDLPGSLIQLRQILRPDGLLLATLPGVDTLHELRDSLLRAESEITGGAAQRIDAFTDIRDAGSLLQRAGFALPVVDQEVITVRYDTPLDLIRDLRTFGATFHVEEAKRPPLTRAVVARMMELYAENHADDDGRIRASFSFVSLSGWVPHDSQQKPLKPGSAKTKLADALNVKETKL